MQSLSLTALAAEQVAAARDAGGGRSATTIHGGTDRALRQTVLALAAGASLAEHDSPGEATLQVLTGHVRLTTDSGDWDGTAGDQVDIPPQRHGLTAVEDSAVLLTVVVTPRP